MPGPGLCSSPRLGIHRTWRAALGITDLRGTVVRQGAPLSGVGGSFSKKTAQLLLMLPLNRVTPRLAI